MGLLYLYLYHVIILPHGQFSHCDNRRTDIANTALTCHNLVSPAHNIPGVSNTQPANSFYMALSPILFQLQNIVWSVLVGVFNLNGNT